MCSSRPGRVETSTGPRRRNALLSRAVTPTSSILHAMRTVDSDGNEVEVETHGRHDPCVGIRAVPVGEAMMACVLADHLLRHRAQNPDAPATTRLPRN